MKTRWFVVLMAAGVIASIYAFPVGLVILILAGLVYLAGRNEISCESCIIREGLWCRCRPVAERVDFTLVPDASELGRAPCRVAWKICMGSFYRGRE
jgi:hypothetical protein